MKGSLEASLVRICTAEGHVFGAGFLVGQRHILTCAHVVSRLLNLPDEAPDRPQGVIWLDFPFLAPRMLLTASVVQWCPLLSDGTGDIAGLELQGDPPTGAEAAHFAPSGQVWGDTYRAFGFPEGQDDGVWSTGHLLARQGTNWLQLQDDNIPGFAVIAGFSGTPVWDEKFQGVVGMIVASSQPTTTKVAFALPSDMLIASWPQLVSFMGPLVPRNPYKGLRSFTQRDATDFFGRETVVEKGVELVRSLVAEQPARSSTRLLTILGPSGAGKSSLVMAGLLPHLQQGAIPGSESWVYLDPMVPGKYPIEALTRTLKSHFSDTSFKTLREDLEDDAARGLHLLATQVVKQQGSKVVLLIDQGEELFTQPASVDERQRFLRLLLVACSEPRGPLIVLLTLRADFYDRPMQYPDLYGLIETQHLSLLAIEPDDLRRVVEQPATLPDVQVTFEGDLVNRLLADVAGQVGALPLLQFTLDQLFQRRRGHQLILSAYRELGGVKGALTGQAEATYAALPSLEHRRLSRALFVRLIDPGASEQDTTRRRASLTELSLPDPEQTTLMREAADAFVAARLLTTNEVAGAATIEVSHEALIREWPRLSDWLREAREDIALQQSVSADTVDWLRHGRPLDRLYRGTKLVEAQAWATRSVPSADEAAFLQASAMERHAQEQVELQQRMRELTLQRRAANRLRLLVAVLSIFSVIVIVFASIIEIGRERADVQAKMARSQALAADANYALTQDNLALALLLSVKANQTWNTYEARNSLLNALDWNPQIVTMLRNKFQTAILTLAFGSDGRMLYSSNGFKIYVWDTETKRGRPLLTIDRPDHTDDVAFSSLNQTLVTSSTAGVWLWHMLTGEPPVILQDKVEVLPPGGYEPSTPIAISVDGKFVASGRCWKYAPNANPPLCVKAQIIVLNVLSKDSNEPIATLPTNMDVQSVAFSPNGQVLASSSGTSIQLWNVTTKRLLTTLIANSNVKSIAFSPKGQILASSGDTSVQLWNVATHQLLATLNATQMAQNFTFGSTGQMLAFSPNGQVLASSSGRSVQLWDMATRQPLATLTGDAQPKTSIAFSPDSQTLASGSQDGTIIVWNINAKSTISHQIQSIGGARSAVFSSRDGKLLLLTGSEDGRVLLQEAKTGKLMGTLDTVTTRYPIIKPKSLYVNPSTIVSLALSGDGEILASGRGDGTIILWNMKTRKIVTGFVHPGQLYKVVLSSNGKILASSGYGGSVVLWDVAKGISYTLPYHTKDPSGLLPITLRPNGTLLAVGICATASTGYACTQEQIQFWDVATDKPLGQPLLEYHEFDITDLAFSPDSMILASSSPDGIMLWNVATRTSNGPLLLPTSDPDDYDKVQFSSNGAMLVSYSTDGTQFRFVLWDVKLREPLTDVIQGDSFGLRSMAFSPNGQQLAAVVGDSSTNGIFVFTLWDITIKSWEGQACSIANRNLTGDEWDLYVKDGAPGKACPGLAT